MVRITTLPEKWRFVCPRSADVEGRRHTNWYPLNGVFRCRSCEDERNAGADIDPDYSRLWDQREGEWVGREEVELATRSAGAVRGD